MKPSTLGQLKDPQHQPRFHSVKDEVRRNLMTKVQSGEEIFPGIVGYEETVLPGLINALLSRHNFILLGLRGQAKSRILRGLTNLLDEEIPVIAESEINDDPFFPISSVSKRLIEEKGDALPVRFLRREERYVEKLATPDVTVADIIGDIDPIKAAREGRDLSDFANIHFGLLPRAHRGIFAINELPDLAPKIQVALFNIMQEGDVQIKGFPIRLPLDVLLVFTANPEDYTARGKIITPLKDRIGAEIRTHYPHQVDLGKRITEQEAWREREEIRVRVPDFVEEVIERVAFAGRKHKRIDDKSGVSQRLPITCMETAISNAERRALLGKAEETTVRVADVYAALPAITGKLELTYEGELKGADRIATDLIHSALRQTFQIQFGSLSFEPIIQWFELGGEIEVTDQTQAGEYWEELNEIQGMDKLAKSLKLSPKKDLERTIATLEFILEGLCSVGKLSRRDAGGYEAGEEDSKAEVYRRFEEGNISFS